MSFILRIFHSLSGGEDESEKDIMLGTFFCNTSISLIMDLELDETKLGIRIINEIQIMMILYKVNETR